MLYGYDNPNEIAIWGRSLSIEDYPTFPEPVFGRPYVFISFDNKLPGLAVHVCRMPKARTPQARKAAPLWYR